SSSQNILLTGPGTLFPELQIPHVGQRGQLPVDLTPCDTEEHAETCFSAGDQLSTSGGTVVQQPKQRGCSSVQIRHTPTVPRSTPTCPLWPSSTSTMP